jgi:hypothetical protein
MKTLKIVLLAMLFALPYAGFSQTGPPAPNTSGIYAILDTNYIVGTNALGVSKARITLQNPTSTLYAAVQFRVFYDKTAFTNASVALVGSATNLDLQQVVNTAQGYVTITLVYTGNSGTYSFANGERFEITFTHATPSVFYGLSSIADLTWTPVIGYSFPQLATAQSGMDTPLNLYSYGGHWYQPHLAFHGTFTNVTGTGAKNLTLALEKKVKTGSTWSQHAVYTTDTSGRFSFSEIIDTTYYDVRLAVKGDTLGVGNVVSTADAQLINQWAIGGATPVGWNFFTADVNGDNSLSISDAYGVFGKIAGRISVWPNSVKNIKFFTPTEYNTINTATSNFTATYPGITNFYYNILPNQPDSVTYYVMVPGDANGTGYHMARVTPIDIIVGPAPGVENSIYNVIDERVEYDFPTSAIEVNVPHLSVQEGNIVDIPVTVHTNGAQLASLQFGLKYNDTLLDFTGVEASAAASKWITYVNANDNQVDWGGYDNSNIEHPINDGERVVTLQFIAKKPQIDWSKSPLWTTNKFAGNTYSNDLNITPANGVLQVFRMTPFAGHLLNDYTMEIYPNPTIDEVNISFKVSEPTKAELKIYDIDGKIFMTVMEGQLPKGQFRYTANLGNVSSGVYTAILVMQNGKYITKKIIKQN